MNVYVDCSRRPTEHALFVASVDSRYMKVVCFALRRWYFQITEEK